MSEFLRALLNRARASEIAKAAPPKGWQLSVGHSLACAEVTESRMSRMLVGNNFMGFVSYWFGGRCLGSIDRDLA
jgi:hypothetical protein